MNMFGGPTPIIITTRPLRTGDIAALESVLRTHIRDAETGEIIEGEVASVLAYMRGGRDALGRQRNFLTACNPSGVVVGCAAISEPDALMKEHFGVESNSTRELLNVFTGVPRRGVGRVLFDGACEMSRSEGGTLLVVNSGPRYRASWPFYDAVCDSSNGFITDYYGAGRHAKTWRKSLLESV